MSNKKEQVVLNVHVQPSIGIPVSGSTVVSVSGSTDVLKPVSTDVLKPGSTDVPVTKNSKSKRCSLCGKLLVNMVVFIVLFATIAWLVMTQITSILAIADTHSFNGTTITGYTGIKEYCGTGLRNTMIVYAAGPVIFGVLKGSNNPTRGVLGFWMFIFYIVVTSLIGSFYEINDEVCYQYMEATYRGVNSPYWSVKNEIGAGVILTIFGLIVSCVNGCSSSKR